MVITIKHRILISCPGDVGKRYMNNIADAVDAYNKKLDSLLPIFEESYGYVPFFETMYWIDDADPVLDYGKSTQQVIDEQLVNKADGTIAFFYTRLGKDTGEFPSGTVEEIEKTNQRNRPVSIVHITTEDIPSDLLGDGSQYKKLQDYLGSFQVEKKGYVASIPPEKIQQTIEHIFNRIVIEYYRRIGNLIRETTAKIE